MSVRAGRAFRSAGHDLGGDVDHFDVAVLNKVQLVTDHLPAAGDGEAYATFGVRHHEVDQLVVVAVTGEVDAVTAPALSAAIGEVIAGSPAGLIVDLSDVDFLASAGLGVLIATHDQLAGTATQFGVVADGPMTRRPITVLGLDTVITLYRTVKDALAEMRSA